MLTFIIKIIKKTLIFTTEILKCKMTCEMTIAIAPHIHSTLINK